MLDFTFTAKEHGTGKVIKGTVQADTRDSASKLLTEKGLFVVSMDQKKQSVWGLNNFKFIATVSAKDKVIFIRQLATLVKAGLPITQALNTAIEQIDNKKFKDIVGKIRADVEGGSALSEAFGRYPETFNRTFISLVNAGEQSGTLDKALEKLADQMEKDHLIVSKIRGAMVYPLVVLVAILGLVVFMVITVVPQIKSLYEELGKSLPFLTRMLLALSSFLQNFWWLTIIAIIAAAAGFRGYIRTTDGRRRWDKLKLDLPPFNGLFRKVYMARFTSTLGVLVNAGVPILEALAITADAVGNVVIKAEVLEAAEKVKSGNALSGELAKKKHFTSLVPQMIKIGEDSGTLGEMLDRVAKFYEDEVDQAVKNLSTLIEPILLVVMGGLVAIVIMAVLFPVYNLAGNGLGNLGQTNGAPNSGGPQPTK